MAKLNLVILTLFLSLAANAQTTDTLRNFNKSKLDSLLLYNVDFVLPADSGLVFGMNVFNDIAFAEKYNYSYPDTFKVIGLVTGFSGTFSGW